MSRKTEVVIEEGSTNVYADLGYADAAEMQRKSQLAAEIARAIKARRLTQQGAAELLGVDQSKVSRITRGQFRGVSEAKLLELVTKLGHDVKIDDRKASFASSPLARRLPRNPSTIHRGATCAKSTTSPRRGRTPTQPNSRSRSRFGSTKSQSPTSRQFLKT